MADIRNRLAAASGEDERAHVLFDLANESRLAYTLGEAEEQQRIEVAQDPASRQDCGGILWESELLLAEEICFGRQLLSYPRPCPSLGNVVELGAGCGLAGMCAAALGVASHVVLTDSEGVVPLLEGNARRNEHLFKSPLTVARCDWTSATDASELRRQFGEFDTAVAGDVVFSHHLVDPFIRCMGALLRRPGGKAVVCAHKRCERAHNEFERMSRRLFACEDLELPELPGLAANDCSFKLLKA